MKEYHKIKGVYRFDEKTHLPLPVIDSYFEPVENNRWIFTEKIDGTNIRIIWDGHKPLFMGRTENSQLPTKLYQALEAIFIEELFEQRFGETPVVLYGEGYGGKIQAGGLYAKEESFILFDVGIGNVFLEHNNVKDIAEAFNIPCVPILCEGSLEDGITYVRENTKSEKQVCSGDIEGLIGTPVGGLRDRLGHRIIVKIKQEHFKTK